MLENALQSNPPNSVAEQLDSLLKKLDAASLPLETVRQLRAVEALEMAGTPEATQLVEKLAQGAAGDPLTVDAKAAAERMKRKSGI